MTEISSFFCRQKPLILVTDDDSSIRSLLMMALEEEDYEVEEAINGQECLAKYSRLQPDLVLLDAVMPEVDGFTCCQRLRSLTGEKQVPILMITFLDDQESIEQAFAAGATDYITKPIHWSVLRQRVKRLLASSQILIEAKTAQDKLLDWQAWEHFFRGVLRLLCQSWDIWESLPTILTSILDFSQFERIVLYQLDNNRMIEAVVSGYPSIQDISGKDLFLETQYALEYQQGQIVLIDNITQARLTPAILKKFASLKTQALLIVPILIQEKVWGLLCVHSANNSHHWDELVVERFYDLANLLALSVGR